MKKKIGDKGFTLVEIIVVLAIVAILAAVTVPSVIGFVNQAKEKALIQEARVAAVAAQMIAAEKFAAGQELYSFGGTFPAKKDDSLGTLIAPFVPVPKYYFGAAIKDGVILRMIYGSGANAKKFVHFDFVNNITTVGTNKSI